MKKIDRLACPECKNGRLKIIGLISILTRNCDAAKCKTCGMYFALSKHFAMIKATSLEQLEEFGKKDNTSADSKRVKKKRKKKPKEGL